MAADLTADLAEAKAEGVSVQEVLGTSAFDPRAFASALAAERGVVPAWPPAGRSADRKRWVGPAVAAALALVGLVAGLTILSGRALARLAVVLAAPFGTRKPRLVVLPVRTARLFRGVLTDSVNTAVRPFDWLLLLMGIAGVAPAAYWFVQDVPTGRRSQA